MSLKAQAVLGLLAVALLSHVSTSIASPETEESPVWKKVLDGSVFGARNSASASSETKIDASGLSGLLLPGAKDVPQTNLPRSTLNADQPVALLGAVRAAVERHPTIADALASLAQQSSALDVARAGYYPQIRTNIGSGRLGPQESSTIATLSASQMLYDFGKTSAAVSQAKAGELRQQTLVLKQIDEIAKQAGQAVVSVHRYQKLVKLANEQLVAINAVYELAQMRAAAGLSTKSDPVQARARVEAAIVNVQQIESSLQLWRGRLQTLIGSYEVSGVAELPRDFFDGLKFNSADLSVLERVPEVLAAQADRLFAQAALQNAQAQRFPTITLDASVNKTLGAANSGPISQSSTTRTYSVNLSNTLFQGGAQAAQIRGADAGLRAALARVESARLNVQDQARSLIDQVAATRRRIELLETRQRTILETRSLYRQQYTLGSRSILDLLSAEQEIYQANSEREIAIHDLWANQIDYTQVSGQIRSVFMLNNSTIQGFEILP